MYEERAKTSKTSDSAIQQVEDEEKAHARCVIENEEWNRQVALMREERLQKQREAHRENILKNIDEAEKRQKQRLEKIEQMVREEKVYRISKLLCYIIKIGIVNRL